MTLSYEELLHGFCAFMSTLRDMCPLLAETFLDISTVKDIQHKLYRNM
jgi:hypothetical protein